MPTYSEPVSTHSKPSGKFESLEGGKRKWFELQFEFLIFPTYIVDFCLLLVLDLELSNKKWLKIHFVQI